jgi:hypothetical protein
MGVEMDSPSSGWDKCLQDGRAAGGLSSDGSIVWKVSRVDG